MSANSIFLWKRYRPHVIPDSTSDDCIIEETFQEEGTGRLNLVSDASIHVAKRKAAGAWHLYATSKDKAGTRRVVRTLQHQQLAHSYRHELETFYHALNDANSSLKNRHTIEQYMDNEGGLTKIAQEITTPRQMMGTDMDIVLAYNKLRESSRHTILPKWVMGHADEKKKDDPDTITAVEWENIGCDTEANARVEQDLPPNHLNPSPATEPCSSSGRTGLPRIFEAVYNSKIPHQQ